MFHQTLPKYPHVFKVWLLPRLPTNTCITRTLMCKSMQVPSTSKLLTRITHQRYTSLQLSHVRTHFKFNKAEVTKDIMLYKLDKFWLFRLIGVFMGAQLSFWSYLLYNSSTATMETRRFVQVKFGEEGVPAELKNWSSWEGINYKMSGGRWPYVVPIICIGSASLILFGGYAYCRKNIHAIILRKGGEFVTIFRFGILGRLTSFTVPLKDVSAQHARHDVRQHLPLTVKGHRLHYLIDKDGKYYNVRLFDQSVGVHRSI